MNKCHRFSEEPLIEVKLSQIRPYMSEIWPLNQLKPGDRVLMNYNLEYPNERGYWYDVEIQKIKNNKGGLRVIGDILVGLSSNTEFKNRRLMFLDEIYKIKPYELIAERSHEHDKIMQEKPSVISNNKTHLVFFLKINIKFVFFLKGASALYCITCRDDILISCFDCGCYVCGSKKDDDKQIMCDECNHPYHLTCLSPPLKSIPEDDWLVNISLNFIYF